MRLSCVCLPLLCLMVSVFAQSSDRPSSSSPGGPTGPDTIMPLHIPPYNATGYNDNDIGDMTCLLYMEGVSIVAMNHAGNDRAQWKFAQVNLRPNDLTWSYGKGDVECSKDFTNASSFSFTIRLKTKNEVKENITEPNIAIAANTDISFKLTLVATADSYWKLNKAEPISISFEGLHGGFQSSVAQSSFGDLDIAGVNGVYGHGWVCSLTQALWFNTDHDNMKIGVMLYNTQLQLTGINSTVNPDLKGRHYFSRAVDDCVGTFSPGSWMGILSALVLLGGLMFGYIMLQSVQTIDRFDDPKHKQIIINVRE